MNPLKSVTMLASKGAKAIVNNSPVLLAAAAGAGVIFTVVAVIKATRASEDDIREAEELLEQANEKTKHDDPQVRKEMKKKIIIKMIKKIAPKYAVAFVSGIVTLLCIFGCQSINHRRQAALATVYSVTENTLRSYEAKVKELVGKKKATEIHDAIAKDNLDRNVAKTDNTIILTGEGELICYDEMSGQTFKSNPEKIRQVVNSLNERLLTEMFIPLNDFYYELGIKKVKLGEELGWNIDSGLIEMRYSSHLDEFNRPMLDIDYTVEPRFDYRRLP